MVTAKGIYYNLSESHYVHEVGNTKYYFSSRMHLVKFKEKLQEARNDLNTRLTKRYGIDTSCNKLADISLYNRVETRGFYITHGGVEIQCLKNITLNGETMILRKSKN